MPVIIRDHELQQELEQERQRRFGNAGSLAKVARDILRDHFTRKMIAAAGGVYCGEDRDDQDSRK